MARLAARLDALSRGNPPPAIGVAPARRADALALLLPSQLVATLALQAGDRIAVQVPGLGAFTIEVLRHVPEGSAPPPP